MDHFLRYFYQDMGRVFGAFVEIISALFNFLNYLLNFPCLLYTSFRVVSLHSKRNSAER